MARTTPGVRLLPNAITVLALCAGLSAVQFALVGQHVLAIGAIGVAAVLDSLDGRIARLLDATSKMGAELDSLSDAISFGVAPALVLYIWLAEAGRLGWVAALIFAVCIVLRLARFNTLLDDTEQPPYAGEFFVGVPAPAGGLLVLLPVIVTLQFGEGWWSSQAAVWLWTVAVAGLLISRIPTLSLKKLRAPAKAVAPLLVGVGLVAAAIIQYPLIALIAALLLYLVHIPYSVHRYRWLAKHPEAWDVPPRERRAIRRARSQRRLGLRRPQFRRVAGAARRAVLRPRAAQHVPRVYPPEVTAPPSRVSTRGPRRRNWRRIGLRRSD
ncbi:CDP-diacylglycerol--serine O-phosphatidyltransferase [Saccharomonospora amisosensis]|uniref:CDP-diacylglycerol--serine O-phosphatidyltransferase n=1 Tax=Saccharomonospora amisosensis TaxID=1128677 RepID=A0A7X5ULL7_9PSEU|nr:CDP-diacylglycerol--serine O-phosphatidyltransferase [Saccharomonospora amisosensis]NIJ10265.1 CDP-diacylglycerol--serine O-phosphatidyltransferase [Saccharomonospora amisosensis]